MRTEHEETRADVIDLGTVTVVTHGSAGGADDMITPRQPGNNGISED